MARKIATEKDIEAEMDQDGVGGLAAKRIGLIASTAPMASGTLAGDLRDAMIDIYKTRPKPWPEMTQAEQQDIGRAFEYAARAFVVGISDEINSTGKENPVRAILESYQDKGDVRATLKVKTLGEDDANEAIMTLHRARGKMVLITIASADDYLGERDALQTDPDQNGLQFEAGNDDDLAGD